MVSENIRMALRSMASSKMRTFLSLLGIVIGVASVVAIMNLGRSAAVSMSASFDAGGLNTITIRPRGNARETMVFTEDFSYTLQNEIEGIAEVLPLVSSSAIVRYRGEIAEGVDVQGVTSDYFASNSLEVEDGRFFTAMDNLSRRQVAVIGSELASDLFPAGNAVGSYISVMRNQARSFEVVGVLAEHDTSQGSSFDDVLFMPYTTYTERFRRTDQVGTYNIKTEDGYDAVAIADNIENYLDTLIGSDYYRLFSPATMKAMSDEITGTFTTFLAAIAAISLAVGGIGISARSCPFRDKNAVSFGISCSICIWRPSRTRARMCHKRDRCTYFRLGSFSVIRSNYSRRRVPDFHRNLLRLVSCGEGCEASAYGSIAERLMETERIELS